MIKDLPEPKESKVVYFAIQMWFLRNVSERRRATV